MSRRHWVADSSRPRWGIWGELKLWRQIENERFSYVCQVIWIVRVWDIFQLNSFAVSPQSTNFYFLQTMSSTSPNSEMGFDSEDSEIYYIAEVETEGIDESRLSISQTSSGDANLIYMLTTLWSTKSGQSNAIRMWTLTRTRTNSEWKTRRQHRSEQIVKLQRVACVYYFRAFFALALKYTFVLTLKSVRFHELF